MFCVVNYSENVVVCLKFGMVDVEVLKIIFLLILVVDCVKIVVLFIGFLCMMIVS